MPAFKVKLDEQQIKDVAAYVVDATRRVTAAAIPCAAPGEVSERPKNAFVAYASKGVSRVHPALSADGCSETVSKNPVEGRVLVRALAEPGGSARPTSSAALAASTANGKAPPSQSGSPKVGSSRNPVAPNVGTGAWWKLRWRAAALAFWRVAAGG